MSTPQAPPGRLPPSRTGRFPRVEHALRRMRGNPLLRWTAVLSFLCWGGMAGLVIFRRVSLLQGGQLALLSLAAWFFLVWWFPILEQTIAFTARRPGKAWIGVLLEGFAIGSVALVHVLLAIMVVFIARS